MLRLIDRCRRWPNSRGFGVQSPTDYRFVREVVRGRSRHGDGGEARVLPADVDHRKASVYRFYERLSAYCRPEVVLSVGSADDAADRFLQAGWRESMLRNLTAEDVDVQLPILRKQEPSPQKWLIRLRADDLSAEECHEMARWLSGGAGCVLLIEGIHESSTNRSMWQTLCAAEHGIVTFDLYECGVIFYDKKRYKQNYIVNIKK